MIRPDKEISQWNGVHLQGIADSQRFRSVTGTIVAVPKELHFMKEQIEFFGAERPMSVIKTIRELNSFSVRNEYAGNLVVGDRVFFQYMAHSSPWVKLWGKKHICVHYDMLVAKIGPLVPLNNLLFVQFPEKEDIATIFDINDYSRATVTHASIPSGTLDGALIDESISVGDTVLFDKKYAARVEVDEFNTLNEGRQSSLFKIHRKYVTGKL